MVRRIRFSSGRAREIALPDIPRLRAMVWASFAGLHVARTVKYSCSANPKQSKPAPRLAVEAGTRTSNDWRIELFTERRAALAPALQTFEDRVFAGGDFFGSVTKGSRDVHCIAAGSPGSAYIEK